MDPDIGSLLVSGPLQNVSLAYKNSDYISEEVFPTIDSPSPEAKIGKYTKGDWFRDEAAIKSPGTRAPRGGYKIEEVNIQTTPYWFAKEVTEDDRRLAALPNTPPMQPDIDAVSFVTEKILLKKEILTAATILNGVWSDDGAGGLDIAGKWAAGTGNTFIHDIETWMDYIKSQTGFKPNYLLVSGNVMKELKQETTILERIKYTQKGVISEDLIASLFGLNKILVGGAIKNTGNEKKIENFTASRLWEKNAGKGSAFLFYRPNTPGLKIPSSGYQVRRPFLNGEFRRIRTWFEAAENQDVYEATEELQILQTGADLGKLFKDVIAD